MVHKYEIYKDRSGEYRVRFKYNSETIWTSEGYSIKSYAEKLIERLKKNAPNAPVEDSINEMEELRRRLERAPVPAADRIVTLDHNSAAFKEFKAAFHKLEKSIRTSNDLGEMSSEEVEVAQSEISQIGSEKQLQWVRPAHIWQIAKSTLLWLLEKVAGTAVEKLVLSALSLLAKLLGII